MLRVLQIGPLPPPWGGVQTNLDGIHGYLLKHGHEAAGLNLTRHRRPNTPTAFYPSSAYEVFRLLHTIPCDIVHFHIGGNVSARLLALCLVITGLPGKRSVLSIHSGGYPTSPAGRKASYWTLAGFCFRRFDRVVAVNQELITLLRRCGVQAERARLIAPYWVPEEPPALENEELRSFFGAHSRVILSVGLLEPEYDLPRQLAAFEELRRSDEGLGLLWIGSGALEADLRKLIAASPARKDILLAGDIPRPQTLAAIAGASVLWRTTLYDGDAVSIREALHFGTHVIATDNGMRPEGVLTVAGDGARPLAQQTLRTLAGPAATRRRQMGETNLQAMLDLYRELVREDELPSGRS